MKTSKIGRAVIEAFEGLFLNAYRDSKGVWTIGYGHTTAAGGPKVYPGMKITAEKADELLAQDLYRVEEDVKRIIKVPLNQNEFDALVSFHFNTGALKSGSIDEKLNRGDKAAAMSTLLQYKNIKVNGQMQPLAGLIRRRKAEKLLFEGQVDLALATAGVDKNKIKTKPEKTTTSFLGMLFDFIKSILMRFK